MNVLFLLPRFSEKKEDSTLEKELVKEFERNRHNCTVVTLLQNSNKVFEKKEIENIELIKINTGKYNEGKINKIEKGITLLKLPYIFGNKIPKLINRKIDLIILSTPMMNNPYLIKKLKEVYSCKVLLIIWDIFPQNAVDLGMMKLKFLINFFHKKYLRALNESDFITCMSEGNKKYLEKKFNISPEKMFVLKNWAMIKPKEEINREEIRKKYNFSKDDFMVIFGGNMGKPQKLENILSLAEKCLENKNIKFLFIGSGSEKGRLEEIARDNNLINVFFFNQVPREDYEKVTASCDIGLVSLDERFTVPNFPSKTTDYLKLSLPILASLDKCASGDYGDFLQNKVKGGLFAQAGNIEQLYGQFMKLYSDENLRKTLGNNGRKYYEGNLGVDKAYETIVKNIKIKVSFI